MQKIRVMTTHMSCRYLLAAGLLYLLEQSYWLGRLLYYIVLRGA